MKNQKKLLLNLVFSLLCIVFPLTVNAAQQANLGEENRTLEVGAESQLLVPETKENIKWKCNKKIVKIKKIKGSKKQTAVIKALKKGNCIVTAQTSQSKYHFYIHVEPKSIMKTIKNNKLSFQVNRINKSKRYIILRLNISNGTKKSLDIEPKYKLQKKSKGKWKTLTTDNQYESTALIFPKQTNYFFSFPLSNIYNRNRLKKGNYRIGIVINQKMKYAKFKIK